MDISSLNNYFELYGGMAIFIVVLLEYMNSQQGLLCRLQESMQHTGG